MNKNRRPFTPTEQRQLDDLSNTITHTLLTHKAFEEKARKALTEN